MAVTWAYNGSTTLVATCTHLTPNTSYQLVSDDPLSTPVDATSDASGNLTLTVSDIGGMPAGNPFFGEVYCSDNPVACIINKYGTASGADQGIAATWAYDGGGGGTGVVSVTFNSVNGVDYGVIINNFLTFGFMGDGNPMMITFSALDYGTQTSFDAVLEHYDVAPRIDYSMTLFRSGVPNSATRDITSSSPASIGVDLAETADAIVVTLDRAADSPLDLTPLIAPGTLKWSSVVPGGFASFQATLIGDPRQLAKAVPYLAIVRVIGAAGRTLFEGQIEDKNIAIADAEVGLAISAFGLQNATKEKSLRRIWAKRDMQWDLVTVVAGMKGIGGASLSLANQAWVVNSGQYDPTNASLTGVQIIGANSGGASVADATAATAEFDMPLGLTAEKILGTAVVLTTNGYVGAIWGGPAGSSFGNALVTFAGSTTTDFSQSVSGDAQIRLGAYTSTGGSSSTITPADGVDFYNLRVLGTTVSEDVAAVAHAGGGFYGDTLIRDIAAQIPALAPGVIDSGSDFPLDHLDAGVRRTAYAILNEVASYYSREWAVWEDAKLTWVTPNLRQHQWIIPIAQLADLNLDGSTVNAQKQAIVLYTDAASGLTAEQSTVSVDRRNPYVLRGRAKDLLVDGGTMTANTALQLSSVLLNDLGFGPVPSAGTVALLGDTIVQHAQGNAVKAWEIRAGDNVTIPELPLADVFTQDGRGEVLFHVISSEADGETGLVTLTLDSYGSKRSDVLLARLAAVTNLLGG